jgi:hypothetical protein
VLGLLIIVLHLLFLSSHLLLFGDLGPALSRFELARRD